ncbi:hypothetical protein QFC24_006777 [Naganishia onofrii]|uniref:Uncharacterized protein n=1 Tax=Naganishia onofrii TaxID=1851511 RepID=A0ACC2WYY8_9TREE|nr:hypothetical protein QFC24_006777 [Naganishia onofrii]
MALTLNLTIDDFDPLIAYTNPLQWTTPNPQDHPSWFNQTQQETGSVWHQATYHQTNVPGAELRFNFTGKLLTETFSYPPHTRSNPACLRFPSIGASLDIYGFSNTSYQVIIDPSISQPYTANITTSNALASTSSSTSRTTLFSTTSLSSNAQLAYAQHEVVVRHVGLQDGQGQGTGVLGLDLVVIGGIPVGAEGATLTNTTIDDPDTTAIKYTGSWTTNNVTDFWGGSSIYTNTPGDTISLSFTGSAIYVFGDQVNDHGYYTVLLNSTQYANLTGRSGCAGGEGEKQCEKLGGLHFFAGGLPEGMHEMQIVNGGTAGAQTYFDLDRITYTSPSNYTTTTPLTNLECPFVNCTASSSSSTTSKNATTSASTGMTGTSSAAQGQGTASASSTTPTSAAARTVAGKSSKVGTLSALLVGSVLVMGLWASV